MHCIDFENLLVTKVQAQLLVIVRAITVIDIVNPLVPMVINLLYIELDTYEVNKPKLFNFGIEIGVHQRHLVVIVKKEVLLHNLLLSRIVDEFECLFLDLELGHCYSLNGVLAVENAIFWNEIVLHVEMKVDLSVQIDHDKDNLLLGISDFHVDEELNLLGLLV